MSARVLIAGFPPASARIIKARLGSGYFQPADAETGPGALRFAREWQPDVLLLGATVPEMDGFEVCRRIKSDPATRNVLVVLATAPGEPDQQLRGLEAGADDFLSKHSEIESVPRRVRGLVRLKRAMDEWRARAETARELGLAAGLAPAPVVSGISALIIDKPEAEAKRFQEWLSRDAIEAVLEDRTREPESEPAAKGFGLVVLSLALRASGPYALLPRDRASERRPRVPLLLIVDGEGDERRGGFDFGANDGVLRPVTEGELRVRARNQALHRLYQNRLRADFGEALGRWFADPLTGVFAQRYVARHLPRLLAGNERRDLAVLLIDVDQLSQLNESHGRANGDRALIAVAEALRSNLRAFDTLARYDDVKFIALMPGTTLAEAIGVGERLRDAVAATPLPADARGPGYRVTVSVGVAAGTGASTNAAALLRRAESALYGAKCGGRNRVELAEGA